VLQSPTAENSVRAFHHSGEIARFLLGGASTTLVSYAIYFVLLRWLPYVFAYAVAYASGIVWSYLMNTLFVFRHRPSLMRAALFPLVYVAQYIIGTALLVLLVEGLHLSQALAPLAVIVLTLPLTYVLSRRVITGDLKRSSQRQPPR
jgi:putative flippase GtrA